MSWYAWSIIAAIFAAGVTICWKLAIDEGGRHALLVWFFLLAGLVFLVIGLWRGHDLSLPSLKYGGYLIAAVGLAIGYNYALTAAFSMTNPGYVKAIGALEIVLATVGFSVLVSWGWAGTDGAVENELPWMFRIRWLGIGLCILGVVLIGIATPSKRPAESIIQNLENTGSGERP